MRSVSSVRVAIAGSLSSVVGWRSDMTEAWAWSSGRIAVALPLLGACSQRRYPRCGCLRATEGFSAPPFEGRFPVPAVSVSPNWGVGSEPDVDIAGFDQPALIGERDRLRAVGEPELGEDAGDV